MVATFGHMMNADIGPPVEAVDARNAGTASSQTNCGDHVCEHKKRTSAIVAATAESSVGDIDS